MRISASVERSEFKGCLPEKGTLGWIVSFLASKVDSKYSDPMAIFVDCEGTIYQGDISCFKVLNPTTLGDK